MSEEITTPVAPVTTTKVTTKKIEGYLETIGRRKTATARVRLSDAKKTNFIINGQEGLSKYFPTTELVKILQSPFEKAKIERAFQVSVVVNGGGLHAQAEAIRHGITRALVLLDAENLRSPLKKEGFLKRDPRKKERKKPGFKKARKRAQWSKR